MTVSWILPAAKARNEESVSPGSWEPMVGDPEAGSHPFKEKSHGEKVGLLMSQKLHNPSDSQGHVLCHENLWHISKSYLMLKSSFSFLPPTHTAAQLNFFFFFETSLSGKPQLWAEWRVQACQDVNSSKSVFPFNPGPVPHIRDLSSLRKKEEMVRSTLLSIPGAVASYVAITPTLQERGGKTQGKHVWWKNIPES